MPIVFVQHPTDTRLRTEIGTNQARIKKFEALFSGEHPTVASCGVEKEVVVDLRCEFTAQDLFEETMHGPLSSIMANPDVFVKELGVGKQTGLYVVNIDSLGYAGNYPTNMLFGLGINKDILNLVKSVSKPKSFSESFQQACASNRASFLEMNANPDAQAHIPTESVLTVAFAAIAESNDGLYPDESPMTHGSEVVRDVYNKYAGVTADSIDATIVLLPKGRAVTSEDSIMGFTIKSLTGEFQRRFVYTSKSVEEFDVGKHTYAMQATREDMKAIRELIWNKCKALNKSLCGRPETTNAWFYAAGPWVCSDDKTTYTNPATDEKISASKKFYLRLRLRFTVRFYTTKSTLALAIIENSAGAWPRDIYDVSVVNLADGSLKDGHTESLGGGVDTVQNSLLKNMEMAAKSQPSGKRKKGKEEEEDEDHPHAMEL